jgi:hypothetical protein
VLFLALYAFSSLNSVNTAKVAMCFYACHLLSLFHSFLNHKTRELYCSISRSSPNSIRLRLPWALAIL